MKMFTYKEINKIDKRTIEIADKIRSIVDNIKPNYKQPIAEEIMLRECGYYDMKDIVDNFCQMKEIEKNLKLVRGEIKIKGIICN